MPAVTRSYRIRVYPNGAQERLLRQWFGAARWLWNWSLEMRGKAYQRRHESLNSAAVSRRLTRLKQLPRFAWLATPPATCLTQTLRDQDTAFAHFFRRCQQGEQPGYPRFRSRHDSGRSLRFQDVGGGWRFGALSLPKLGRLRLAEALPDMTKPDMVTLSRDAAGRYHVAFKAAVELDSLPATGRAIGVDLGLTHLATLSSGEQRANPRHLAKRLRYLRQQSRALARKAKGSRRRGQQKLRVARAHAKVAQQRNYALHQFTTRLVREFDVICIEDLQVRNMLKHPRLARHIADASWGEFRRQLEYKAKWYGRELIVADTWFASSKTCSRCAHKLDELRLDVRRWDCPKCGTLHDRDHNAAVNLVTAGMRHLAGREGRDLRADAAEVDAACEARTGQIN